MQRLWELLFGIDRDTWTEGGGWSLEWLSLPRGDRMLLLIAVVVLGVTGLVALYRADARRHSWGVRLLLTSLRIAVLLIAVGMLLEPVLVVSREEFIPSHVLLLVDNSPSMNLQDSWRDETEAARVAGALRLEKGAEELRSLRRLQAAGRQINESLIQALSQNGDRVVHVHAFADRLADAAVDPAKIGDLPAAGESTAIGSALRQARLAYAGMPIAGVVVVSDGQSTAGEPLDDAANSLAEEHIPVAAIAVGTIEGSRNAAVMEVETNPVALVRDPNRLVIHLRSRGMQDVPATLLIERRVNGGEWQEFATQEITLGLDGASQEFPFTFTEDRPAKVEFRAALQNAGPQLTADDDVGHAEVRVVRDRLRALFVAGTTFPEVEFLRNALYRDEKIEVSSWLMTADEDYEHLGDVPIRRLPVTQEELDDYDCVILYDPDPTAWPANFPELLTNFVSKAGGGLVYIAGEHQTAGDFDRQTDPAMSWLTLLPVVREPGLFRSEVQMRLSAQSPWQLEITQEGKRDPVFLFADDAEANQRILENLPGMFWHFPVTRAKPGAEVLAVHGDPRMRNEYGPEVLLATQRVGPGRVFFLGFDSTYRWRYLDEQYFDGFWARLIDRAGRNKQLGGGYPFRLTSPQETYTPGSAVKVIARFTDPTQVDPGLDVLHGEVEHGDDEPRPLTLTATGGAGEFSATFTASQPGTHFVRVWMGEESSGGVAKAATLPIEAKAPNAEYDNPTLDRAALETLARCTQGKVFDLTDVANVPSTFPIGKVSRVLEARYEIWDAPLLWGALFTLLCVEWVLRKRWRLI